MLSKNIDALIKIKGLINEHQITSQLHPLTCGNDSQNHRSLVPRLDLINDVTGEYELILCCLDCDYKQDIPHDYRGT